MMTITTSVDLPADSVRPILERALEHDGIDAFSEQFEHGLSDPRLQHTHLMLHSDGSEIGVAALAPDGSVELVVDPLSRRRGAGKALVEEVLKQRPDAGVWAHGNLPAAQALAAHFAAHPIRELLVMEIGGADLTRATDVSVDSNYTALNYPEAAAQWGSEKVDADWLAANNDAFGWHPEQGGWDLERLQRAREAQWFDPAGVCFLYHGEKIAGFHWTKQHPAGVGEVYVVGLHSDFRRKGLGGPLTQIGLRHLVNSGSTVVKLYVEADNEPAVARYRSLGFVTQERHVVYGRVGS